MSYNAFKGNRFLKENFFGPKTSVFLPYFSFSDIKAKLDIFLSKENTLVVSNYISNSTEISVKFINKPVIRVVDNYYKTHTLTKFSHVLALAAARYRIKNF